MKYAITLTAFLIAAASAQAASATESFREWAASAHWQRTANASQKQEKAALECNFEVEKVYPTDTGATSADDIHDQVSNSFYIIKQRGLYKDCMASKGFELVKPELDNAAGGSTHE